MCRRFGTHAAGATCNDGAQCAEMSTPKDAATAAQRIHSVSSAAGDVDLQAVHRASREHPRGISGAVAILARRDVAAQHLPQGGEVVKAVRGHGFLEPGDPEIVIDPAQPPGLPRGVTAVCVDEQLNVIPDGLPCQGGTSDVPAA